MKTEIHDPETGLTTIHYGIITVAEWNEVEAARDEFVGSGEGTADGYVIVEVYDYDTETIMGTTYGETVVLIGDEAVIDQYLYDNFTDYERK